MPTDNDPKSRLWKAIERKRISHERRATTRMHKGLRESIQGVLDNLEQFGPEDALRDLESELDRKPMEQAYQDLYVTIGVSFARDSYQAFKSRKDDQAVEDAWEQFMRNFATTEAGERITSVNRTTLKRIRSVLEKGVEEGLGIEEIAANMEDSTAIHRVRARTIARTEIVSASNKGSLMGAKATGLNLQKEWIDTPDNRTRPSHVKAGQQDPVDHSEDFKVGGYDAEYPGDPSLPADESIHCRCAVASIPYD